jgi:serine/threonine-protein kinase HipA
MANFMWESGDCLDLEVYRLFLRILVGLLLGNTDMHLKNFALLHTKGGLRLMPTYDQVAAAIYSSYQSVALAIGGSPDLKINKLKPQIIITLGKEFRLPSGAVKMAYEQLLKGKENAKEAIASAKPLSPLIQDKLIEMMEKRWNGTFALIGQSLSAKR